MEQTAITLLNSHRIMAIATARPDGWPQNTIAGYANEGFDIFFLIFRSSQKFANIQCDDRISIAVGGEPSSLGELRPSTPELMLAKSPTRNSATMPGGCSCSATRTWPTSKAPTPLKRC